MSAIHHSFHPFPSAGTDGVFNPAARRHATGRVRFTGTMVRRIDFPETVPGRGRGCRVLTSATQLIYVVDGFPGLAEMAKAFLEAEGFPVCAFHDRVRAWQAFVYADPRPALLITDESGGGFSGIELIRRCRALEPNLKTLWISHRDPSSLAQRDRSLLDGFQSRPYCGPLLVQAVRRLCGLPAGAVHDWQVRRPIG